MKRFYTHVSPERPENGEDFVILLDGRRVKTPAKADLSTPNRGVAALIAAEWDAQDGDIIPSTMPLTQILSTQIDKVRTDRAAMTEQLLGYIDTDLLFYRTDDPAPVGEAQAAAWDPIIQAAEAKFGVTLTTTTAIAALRQPAAFHAHIQDYINALDEAHFTILQLVTPLAGSVICGVLFADGQLCADEIMSIARVEERYKDAIYNVDKYGPDPAQEKIDAAMLQDLKAAEQYRDLHAAV